MDLSEAAKARVGEALSPLDVRLRQASVARVAEQAVVKGGTSLEGEVNMVTSLLRVALDRTARAKALDEELQGLSRDYERATDAEHRRQVLSRYLRAKGTAAIDTAQDLAALRKWLDLEAIADRFASEIADQVDDATVAYRAASGLLARRGAERIPDPATISRTLLANLQTNKYEALREAALDVVRVLGLQVPERERLMVMGADVFRSVQAFADGAVGCHVFTQRAAMTALCALSPRRGATFVAEWLTPRDGADDMLRRSHAVALLATIPTASESSPEESRLPTKRQLVELALRARTDPSEHVRQQLARSLAALEAGPALAELAVLALEDTSGRVRGVAALELTSAATSSAVGWELVREVLVRLLERRSSLDIRVVLEAVRRSRPAEELRGPRLVGSLAAVATDGAIPSAIRLAVAATVRRLEIDESPRLEQLLRSVAQRLDDAPLGRWCTLEVLPEYSQTEVCLALLVAGHGGQPLALMPRKDGAYRLMRGEKRGLRAWRLLYELSHPAPDKRQGYPHAHAPKLRASVLVPPVTLAEVTQTAVPGERLVGPEGEWGIALPRVDALLFCLELSDGPLAWVTPWGTLLVRRPPTFWRRLRTRFLLTTRYERFAALRQSTLGAEGRERKAYIKRLVSMGFSFEWVETRAKFQHGPQELMSSVTLEFFP